LYSARSATLAVPKHTLLLAAVYLDSAENPAGSGMYGYLPGDRPSPAMTAEALLCRFYLGATKDDESLERGIRYLLEEHPPEVEKPNFYYWYYATQAMHHWGGTAWDRWNGRMRDVLVELQETAGHQAGSWMTVSGHDHRAGRLYATALAVCTLEVYYRHAPLFRQIDLKKVLE
ncbi:MAG: squalene--hopene cyclase, partial [Pirellulales bacterium]